MDTSHQSGFICKTVLAAIAVGIAVRIVVGTVLTYSYDASYWALTISNFESGYGLYGLDGYYYTPVWGYVLGVASAVAEGLGLDTMGEMIVQALPLDDVGTYFGETSYAITPGMALFLTVLMTAFDLLVGFAVFRIADKVWNDQRRSEICFAVWFLCPFVILVGCAGCMFDALSVGLMLLAIWCLLDDRNMLAGAILATAVMLKFFPAFLGFMLLAYIMKNRADSGRRIAMFIIGGVAMALILVLPQLLSGNIADCFMFLTSRVSSGMSDDVGIWGRLAAPLSYIMIILVLVLTARSYVRFERDGSDAVFIRYVLLSLCVVFLFPSTPQYILLLMPALIMTMYGERKLVAPFLLFVVGTSVFAMSPGMFDLLSSSYYFGIVDTGWLVDTLVHDNVSDVLCIIGGVLQYAATVWVLLILTLGDDKKLLRTLFNRA